MKLERSMHVLAHMRRSEKGMALIAVAIPILVATLGWLTLMNLVSEPTSQPTSTPQVPGAAATLAATARIAAPTSRPTIGAPPTLRVTASNDSKAEVSVPSATNAPAPAAALADDPATAVSNFYALVASHQFEEAARLWSPRMREAFPPEANVNQRFSQTREIQLKRVEVVSQDPVRATVAVDLLESVGQAGQRHFTGAWYMVRGSTGWMLDQPQLQSVP
jgi:hypothetical protein